MADGFWAKVLFDYVAVETTELSVVKGDVIFIEEQNDTGWSLGKKGEDSGWLPSDYVERAQGPGETKDSSPLPEPEPEAEPEPEPEPEAEPETPPEIDLPPEPEEEPEVPLPPPAKKSVSVVSQPKPVAQKAEVSQPKPVARKSEVSQPKPVAQKSEVSQPKPSWAKSEVSQPKPVAQKSVVSQPKPVAQKTEVSQPKPAAATTTPKVKSSDDEKEIIIAMSVNRNFTVVLFDDGLLLLDQKKSTVLDSKTIDSLTTCPEFQEVIDLTNRSYTLAAPKFQQPEHYLYLNSGSQKQRIYIYGAPKPSGNRLEGGAGSKDGDLPVAITKVYQRILKLSSDFGSSATFTSPIALGPLLAGFPAISYA